MDKIYYYLPFVGAAFVLLVRQLLRWKKIADVLERSGLVKWADTVSKDERVANASRQMKEEFPKMAQAEIEVHIEKFLAKHSK
jgi:hypothetical protein